MTCYKHTKLSLQRNTNDDFKHANTQHNLTLYTKVHFALFIYAFIKHGNGGTALSASDVTSIIYLHVFSMFLRLFIFFNVVYTCVLLDFKQNLEISF